MKNKYKSPVRWVERSDGIRKYKRACDFNFGEFRYLFDEPSNIPDWVKWTGNKGKPVKGTAWVNPGGVEYLQVFDKKGYLIYKEFKDGSYDRIYRINGRVFYSKCFYKNKFDQIYSHCKICKITGWLIDKICFFI